MEGEEGEAEEEQSALLSFIEQQASVPRVEDATSRLAVVNCDWEQAPPQHTALRAAAL